MSSGQKNRVSLAKSIINNPKVLLLDEPTASLDPETGDFVRSFLEEYQQENKTSILLASHNMAEVERLCSSVLMMNKGSIIDEGRPEELIKKHGRKNMEEVFFGSGITNFISSLKKIFFDGSVITLLFILNLLSRIRFFILVRLIISSLFLMKISTRSSFSVLSTVKFIFFSIK